MIVIEHNQTTITLPEIVSRMDHIVKMSNSELRRLVEGNAVEINDSHVALSDINKVYNLDSNGLKVRIGKKYILTIRYASKK